MGSVTESSEDHLARHGGGLRTCPRCRWHKRGADWVCSYGKFLCQHSRGSRENVVWLAERPARFGGEWALGCTICSWFAQRAWSEQRGSEGSCGSSTSQLQRGTASMCRLGSRFARFEVRAECLQAEHFKQHAETSVHRRAVIAWQNPDAPLRFAAQATLGDELLLSGAVPQPVDWLRSWRACITPQSWQAASRHLETEHYVHMLRARPVEPRAMQQMARIQAEVIRVSFREWVLAASSLTLSFDDRHGYKMVLFRCDAPLPDSEGTQSGIAARSGLLGIAEMMTGVTLDELAQDYAERVVEDLRLLCARFSTPLGDACDEAVMQRLVGDQSLVKHLVMDGALRKVADYAKQRMFPNAVLSIRDPTHFIRTAIKKPMEHTGNFGKQHDELFGNRHALLKDLQHSRLWQARLEACQNVLVKFKSIGDGPSRSAGPSCGPLAKQQITHVLRHIGYVAHRFESVSGPRRMYVCLMLAIAMVLGDIAGDTRRDKNERSRAEASLQAMTPQHILEAGLSGDFAEVGIRLLRTFDVSAAARDPATSSTVLKRYYTTVQRLFIDGYIFCPVDRTGSIPQLGDHCSSKTLTQIAEEQFADMVHIHYGDKVKTLWSETSKQECAESLAQIQSIARDHLERLKAGFLDSEVYMCMATFDVLSWQRGVDEEAKQLRRARTLCKHYRVPYSEQAWKRVVEAACAKREEMVVLDGPSRSAGETHVDNRRVWSALLPTASSSSDTQVLRATGLEPLVRSYLSLVDSTGDVERGLGTHADFVQHHRGAHEGGSCLSEICYVLKTYGPETESALFQLGPQGEHLLTDFSRSCCRLWRALHGRRFACYKKRANAGIERTGWRLRGSAKAVKLLQHDAFDALEGEAIKDDAQREDGPPDARATFAGLAREKLLKRAARITLPVDGKKLKRFKQDTKKLVETKLASGRWTGFSKELPPLRSRPGNAGTSLMTCKNSPKDDAQPQRGPLPRDAVMRARRLLGREARNPDPVVINLLEDADGMTQRPMKYRRVSDDAVSNATTVKVQTGDDLLHGEAEANKLRAWLSIIALGKKVQPVDSREIQYKPTLKDSHKLCFSPAFATKHPSVLRSYNSQAMRDNSTWSMAPADHFPAKGHVNVTTLEDLRLWMISARRFSSWAGVGVKGATVRRGEISRYGRQQASAA